MKSLLKNKDFFWNTIGSLAFGFTSLIYMIIITRINGVNLAGSFTYAFATANILCTIGSYSGKTFQITETNERILDSDYIYNRLITCIAMNLAGIAFCVIGNINFEKILLIVLLTFYRSIDAFIESFHAILQRNKFLYKAGMSMFFKTMLLMIGFFIIDYVTKNIFYCLIYLIIIELLFAILCDYKMAKPLIKKQKFNLKNNNLLLKLGFSTCIFYFCSNYVINAPKYAINTLSTDEVQAIYGIIIMPSSFLALISIYIVQPMLNKITVFIKENQINNLTKLIHKLSKNILGIGFIAMVICSLIGIPLLELLYGISLHGQLINLDIIILGSICYSIVCMLSAVIIAMRKTWEQLYIILFDALIGYIVSYYLVKYYSVFGASLAYLIIMIIQLILYEFVIWYNIRIKEKEVKIYEKS